MAFNLNTLTAQQQAAAIYIGYYDRAPDPYGMDFWESAVTNRIVSLVDIATYFSAQDETYAVHPFFVAPSASAANAFISELYLNLFNRAPDMAGLEFWSGVLQQSIDGTGPLSVGEIILAIIEGAQNSTAGQDITTLLNKIDVANAWTDAAEAAGLTGATSYADSEIAQNSAKSIINDVTFASSSVDEAKSVITTTFDDFVDSSKFTLTADAPSIIESDSGTKVLVFKATLDEAPTQAISVNYETLSSGTATSGDDFVAVAGVVTFAAGQTVATVSVTVLADAAFEADETIEVKFSGTQLTADVTATGTVTNDDLDPQAALEAAYTAAKTTYDAAVAAAATSSAAATAAQTAADLAEAAVNSLETANAYSTTAQAAQTAAAVAQADASAVVTAATAVQAAAAATLSIADDADVSGARATALAAKTAADAAKSVADAEVANAAAEIVNYTGQTYTLTTGVDVSNVAGTSGNDTYIGTDGTYTTGDNIAAGSGTDRLNLTLTTDTAALIDTSGLENFYVRTTADTSGANNAVNASGWAGVEQVWNDRSTANLSIENLTVLPTVGIINGSDIVFTVDVDATAVDLSGDTNELTIVATNAALATLAIGDGAAVANSVEVVTIQNTGDSVIARITDNDGNLVANYDDIAMSSLTVTGIGSLDLHDVAGANTQYAGLTTVDSTGVALTLSLTNTASTAGTDTNITSTGADDDIIVVAADGTASNAAVTTVSLGDGDNTLSLTNGASLQTLSVTTGDGADDLTIDLRNATVAGTASMTSGAGDDTVSIISDAQQILSVDLGAGDDVLTITTINADVAGTDAIDGGEGIDALRGTSANLNTIATTAAKRATLDNFEQLAVTDLLGHNFNLVTLGLDGISLEDVDSLAADRTLTVANNSTISLDLLTNGGDIDSGNSIIVAVDGASGAGRNSDGVNLEINANFDGAAADTVQVDVDLDFVETLNFTTTDSLVDEDNTLNGGENFVLNVESGDRLSTINVIAELATSVVEQASNFTALNTFNASGSTGGVTVSLANATQGVVATGGDGDDVFTGSGFADEISMDDGNDQVTGGAGADELSGGAGDDQFIFATGDSTETDMDSILDYQAAAAALENDTLVLDSSNDDVGTADADAILSVGADILASDTVEVHTADAAGNLVSGDLLAIVTDGILTLSGSTEDRAAINTLSEWIDVAELVLASYETTVGTDAADVAEYAIAFEFGGNTYVVSATDGNGAADVATDDVIQLVGVTDSIALDTTAAANTILIG